MTQRAGYAHLRLAGVLLADAPLPLTDVCSVATLPHMGGEKPSMGPHCTPEVHGRVSTQSTASNVKQSPFDHKSVVLKKV
jgi:hypothetical protein